MLLYRINSEQLKQENNMVGNKSRQKSFLVHFHSNLHFREFCQYVL